MRLALNKKNDYALIKGSSSKSSLEEAKTVTLEIQTNSARSEFELLLSQTAHQRTALGRLKAQPI